MLLCENTYLSNQVCKSRSGHYADIHLLLARCWGAWRLQPHLPTDQPGGFSLSRLLSLNLGWQRIGNKAIKLAGKLWHCLQSCTREGNNCCRWNCSDCCLQTCQGCQYNLKLKFKHNKVLKQWSTCMNIKQDKPEGKAEVQSELEEGLEVLIQNNIDLIIVEVFTTTFLLFISSHAVHSKVIDF